MSEPVYTTAFSADHQMANIPETGSTSICLRNLVNTVWQNAEGVSRPRPEGADAGRSLLDALQLNVLRVMKVSRGKANTKSHETTVLHTSSLLPA